MAFFQSPWGEAASAGQGIGHSLSQALIQLPLVRAQLAMHMAELAIHKQRYESESLADKARASLYGAEEGYYKARTGELASHGDIGNLLGEALAQNTVDGKMGTAGLPDVLRQVGRAGVGNVSQVGSFLKDYFGQKVGEGQNMVTLGGQTVATGQPKFHSPGEDLANHPSVFNEILRLTESDEVLQTKGIGDKVGAVLEQMKRLPTRSGTNTLGKVREFDPKTMRFK